jgi:RHS repeat-associated protein
MTVTDAVGRSLSFTYDNSNRIIQISDPIGRAVKYTYNQTQNTLATFTDANGGVTQYGYDPSENLNSIIDPRGVLVEQNTYNEAFDGRITQQVLADGGTYQFAYTLMNPGVENSPVLQTVVTDPLGNQTTYRYNPMGMLVSMIDASGQTRVLNRDPNHNNLVNSYSGSGVCASCGNTAAGNVSFTFDSIGNVLSQTDALGNVTTYTYDSRFAKVTSIIDALKHTTTISYDSQGDSLKITDANSHMTQMIFDNYGELTQITDPLGAITKMAYDGLGNVTSVTNALGNVTKMTYDSVSRRIQQTDPLGHSSTTGYDSLNRVVSQTDPRGNATTYKYDAVGDLLSVTDARANATSFTYDPVGRLQTRTSALGKVESYQYDTDSNLIQFTDRRGLVSKFKYDVLNRLVQETYTDATVTRAYDVSGRLLAVNDSTGGAFGFAYDAAGRLISQQEPTGVVQYTPDALGRMSVRQVAGQAAVQYEYDAAGNMISAASPAAGVTYTYYATNLPETLTRTNGVVTSYTFDKLGEALSIVHAKGATALSTLSYTYDSIGNRTAISNNLSQALITLAGKATVDNGNQLLTNSGTTYTYDANGNRLTETSSTGTLTYAWDGRNRLSSITDSKGNKTSMQYDSGRNLMVLSKTVGAATTQQSFVVDALTNVVSLTDASGEPVPVLTGNSIDSHYASVDPVAGALFGVGDALGSNAGTTNSAGVLGSTLKYEPYGQTTGTDAATFPFAFTGRVPILGNVNYFRNRFYDAVPGRFIAEDPIGFKGRDVNLYRYAQANPADYTDPHGTFIPVVYAVVATLFIYFEDVQYPTPPPPPPPPSEPSSQGTEAWCAPGVCNQPPLTPPCPVGTCCPAYSNGNPL